MKKLAPSKMERRAASGLSYREFFEKYASQGKPVIITGLNITEGEPWTLDFFKRKCGDIPAKVDKVVENSITWARHEVAETLPLDDFIDTFTTNGSRSNYYLVDWSLLKHCPQVFGPPPYQEFVVPRLLPVMFANIDSATPAAAGSIPLLQGT